MDLLQILASDVAGRIIIVDDYYEPPHAGSLTAAVLTAQFNHLKKAAHRKRLALLLKVDEKTDVKDLMAIVPVSVAQLWQAYLTDDDAKTCLAPLFSEIDLNRGADRTALDTIDAFCKRLNVPAQTYSSLEKASAALSTCSIAFVDFRFKDGQTVESAVAAHEGVRDSYQGRYVFGGTRVPKIVYLISSHLPRKENAEAFRSATETRAAFFSAQRKSEVTTEWLEEELEKWKTQFPVAFKLDKYLTEMSEAIKAASIAVRGYLDRLELHELAILNVFKLAVDHETLQNYLTWLVSEALASKLRGTPSLQAELLPGEHLPVDGKMQTGTLLFELFSQIAISPVSKSQTGPAFGDVYAGFVPEAKRDPATPREVFLAISPACDLQRCGLDDNVLCVRGVESVVEPDLEELMKHKVLFGQSRHVIRYDHKKTYGLIEWDKKRLTTISVADLNKPRKYMKVARLSELFAQEVKELVLSDVSRIGLPVYPAVYMPRHVAVKMKFGANVLNRDLRGESFECAIVVKGRREGQKEDTKFLSLTDQFARWVRAVFIPEAKAKFAGGQIPAKFTTLENHFNQWKIDLSVELSKNSTSQLDGALVFKQVEALDEFDARDGCMEIIVSAQQ
jgi:hypothetical protein